MSARGSGRVLERDPEYGRCWPVTGNEIEGQPGYLVGKLTSGIVTARAKHEW
jgi:hypothetical protein